jgi:outer membrane protein TolC
LADLTETQVRVAMHAPDTEVLAPGEGLDSAPAPFQGNLHQLTLEAYASRAEIKSIDANTASARAQVDVVNAAKWPVVTAFADGIYANPNPRKFPATQDWFPTWDVGAQLVWSPNDVITSRPLSADAEARVNQLEAQRLITRDGIQVEVMQAYQAVLEADFAIGSTKRELDSAQEAYRVARQLFVNQRGTSTTLTDAETELTRARLDALNASADARIARVRLDHAVGRDVRPYSTER